ncbi:MAG: helix-turn-helix domain-containing protein [Polyangiales bacterium]
MQRAQRSPGTLLRRLRSQRGLSQESLATRASVSPRHLSFVENGRSQPSRDLLLSLGAALDLSLRERNELLVAAGFSAAFRETALDDPAMGPLLEGIDLLFAHAEPHPAVLLDHRWNVLRFNQGTLALFTFLGADIEALLEAQPINVLRLFFTPNGPLRRHVINFDPIADGLLARVEREADIEGDPAVRALAAELRALRGPVTHERSAGAPPVMLPLEVERDGVRLRWFTMLTTIGTPLDITAQSLRVETYVPLDQATRSTMEQLARRSRG